MDAANLEEREAALRRLNEEIDMDARDVFNSADAVLRAGTAPSSSVGTASTTRRQAGGWASAREQRAQPGARSLAVKRRTDVPQPTLGGLPGRPASSGSLSARSRANAGAMGDVVSSVEGFGAEETPLASDGLDPLREATYDAGGAGASGEIEAAAAAGVGAEAMVRLLRTRLAAVESAAKEAQSKNIAAQQDAADMRRQLRAELQEKKALAKQVQQLQQQLDKQRQQEQQGTDVVAAKAAAISDLRKELLAAQKAAQVAEADRKSLDVQLHRMTAEIERLRSAAAAAKGVGKDRVDEARHETAKLEAQVRRLERQKAELLSAFRKQLRLIDVLRRQKEHVEAARLLAFTEDEFVRTLEWAA